MRNKFAAGTIAVFLLVGLGSAASASASTITKSGSTFAFTDPQGEDNDIQLDASSGNFIFTENTATQTIATSSAPGCTGGGTDTVTCPNTGITAITLDAGDGGDAITLGDDLGVPVTASGGVGVDTLSGGNGNDTLNGDAGIDTLFGNAGNDTLNGGDQGDSLSGGDGNDTLHGGDGTDTLAGDNNDDTLDGGTGADALEGGADSDTVTYAASLVGVTASPDGLPDSGATGQAEGDEIETDVEKIVGSPFADNLTGEPVASAAHTLDGAGGDDVLTSAAGDEHFIGGAGYDKIRYTGATPVTITDNGFSGPSGQHDTLDAPAGLRAEEWDGGDGADTLTEDGTGPYTLNGGGGSDHLNGISANNTFIGGLGDDTVTGPGTFRADAGPDGNDTLHLVFGGQSQSTLDYSARTSGGITTNGVNLGHATDGLIQSGGEVDQFNDAMHLIGTNFDDDIGLYAAMLVDGGGGNDFIHRDPNGGYPGGINPATNGGPGNDTLQGGSGQDFLNGGDGNDTVCGGAGEDTEHGDAGNDVLGSSTCVGAALGGPFRDDGFDQEFGDDGNDSFEPGATVLGQTQDNLHGGNGNDTFSESSRGSDAGYGVHPLDYRAFEDVSGGPGFDTLHLADDGHQHLASLNDQADDGAVTGQGITGDDFRSDIEEVDGGSGPDTLVASPNGTILRGGAGPDNLTGGAGPDYLDGGSGPDSYGAGGGDDQLFTRDGLSEVATCGSGNDKIDADVGTGLGAHADSVAFDCEQKGAVVAGTAPPDSISNPGGLKLGKGAVTGVVMCPSYLAVNGKCDGKLTFATKTLKTAKKHKKASPKLGSATFHIAAGKTAKVKVKLSKAARAKLKKKNSLKAHEIVTFKVSGTTFTASKAVKIKS